MLGYRREFRANIMECLDVVLDSLFSACFRSDLHHAKIGFG